MKKVFVALVLVLVLSAQSFAFAPLAYLVAVTGIPAYAWVTSAAVHVGAGAVGVYYALKSNQSSKTDSAGTISRPAAAVFIDSKDLQVVEKQLNAKLPKTEVERISSKQPAKYPKLKAATSKLSYPGYDDPSALPATTQSYVVNQQIHLTASKCVKVSYVEGSTAAWNGNVSGSLSGWRDFPNDGFFEVYHPTSEHGNYPNAVWIEKVHYTVQTAPTPITVPKSVSEYLASVAPTGTVEDTALQDELDQMMQDPDYVPVFSDATTGLPYAPPSQAEVMTPAQIDAHNKAVDAYNKKQQAAESALGAATDAQKAATNAGAAYEASGGNLSTGVGGDASLYQKYLDAKAAASGAQSASDAAQAGLAQDALNDQKEADDSAGEIPGNEERKTLDFTPLHALKSKLDNTYPFNLPGIVLGYYTALKSTPEAPQFDLALPLGQTMHIDLSPFESIALLMRYLIGVLLTSGIIYYIIHFFRGIS